MSYSPGFCAKAFSFFILSSHYIYLNSKFGYIGILIFFFHNTSWFSTSALTCSFTLTASMFRTLFWNKGEAKGELVTLPESFNRLLVLFPPLKFQLGLRCGCPTLWSDTSLDSLFLPPHSPPLPPRLSPALTASLHQYCMHTPPLFGPVWWSLGGLTRSALLVSLRLFILGRRCSDLRLRSALSHGGRGDKLNVPLGGPVRLDWQVCKGLKYHDPPIKLSQNGVRGAGSDLKQEKN